MNAPQVIEHEPQTPPKQGRAVTRKRQEQVPAAPVSETAALIDMISRAASDPSVNIDKMRELLVMRKDIMAQEAEQNFNTAMTQAQSEMRAVAVDSSNPQTKSKYASYFALDKAVRPIYTKAGFNLSFDTDEGAPPECIRVVCYVSCAGHTRKYHVDMPADGKGAKGGDVMTKTHAVGSGMSYGQRYLLKMIFNIAVGEDDDGNAAGNVAIAKEQVLELDTLIEEVGADKKKFLAWLKVDRLEDVPAKAFDRAVKALEAKRAK